MNPSGASVSLIGHVALLAIISFGGVPGVLPDLRDFVVSANGWLTDREFANCFAIVQAIPGPNMILMMSLIGWKVGGLPVAIASALATFGPPCALSFTPLSSSWPPGQSARSVETRALPTLTRSCPRRFTFYVADPLSSILDAIGIHMHSLRLSPRDSLKR